MQNYKENWQNFLLKEAIAKKNADILDKSLKNSKNLDALCKKLINLGWPEDMVHYHAFKANETIPFREIRDVIWDLEHYLAPQYKIINSHDINMYDHVLLDRSKKYDMYLGGKIDKYFWNDQADPREIEKKYKSEQFTDVPPVTVVGMAGNRYDPRDGGHRIFLAYKNGANLPAWVIPHAPNQNKTFPPH